MFAKRSLLGKSRVSNNRNEAPVSGSREAVGTTTTPDASSSLVNTSTLKSPSTSFRRGLLTGGIPQSGIPKPTAPGVRSGLSFTDDIDSISDVMIRKGVTNTTDVMSSNFDSGNDGLPPSGIATHVSQVDNSTVNLDSIMFVDVDSDSHFQRDHVIPHSYSHATSRHDMPSDTSPQDDYTHFVQEVASDPEDGCPAPSFASDAVASYKFDAEQARELLYSRLNALSAETDSLRADLEYYTRQAQMHRSTPGEYEPIMASVRDNISLYTRLLDVSRALGGLHKAKRGLLQDLIARIQEHRKDVSDSAYCSYHWFLCDLFRIGGVTTDYGCDYLDEIDDYGQYTSQRVMRDFVNRVPHLDAILSSFKASIHSRGDSLIGSSSLSRGIIDIMSITSVPPALRGMYPSSVSSVTPDTNVLDDVSDTYKSINTSLSCFVDLKRDNHDLFQQLLISERLQPIYELYALMDLINWDPLSSGDLREREWFVFVKDFNPDGLSKVLIDIYVPLCLNAIDAWNILDYGQCHSLSRAIITIIDHISTDDRGNVIQRLTQSILKVAVSRLKLCCPSGISQQFNDWSISSCWKFLLVHLGANLMCFNSLFTAGTLSNIVLGQIFVERLLPVVDTNELLDAFAVLHFFRMTEGISSSLCTRNVTNRYIHDALSAIARSPWKDTIGITGLLHRLGISVSPSDYEALLLKFAR
ncbi:hypothetical protein BBOV_III000590 [Babesia bovis T2Bo]|uniref:Uncharacterized protein n=1 Tax=Babesia bovis TaxID=5865 RepID=A7AM42_BABBO|nr:hypothetical protein BBOV_III000590 [Babesia bovis T2Bo]EDO07626.1 hypothetical protein BBOV_III000590 [Babesia bovis T2Bo]|eukprot:XP_001611194.1 hypothetical protein [Babesia bovis T2Bo]